MFYAIYEIQLMFNEKNVRRQDHNKFIERLLYFPISHSNKHRLHIFFNSSSVGAFFIRQNLIYEDVLALKIYPFTAKLFNLNFHPLEVVSR